MNNLPFSIGSAARVMLLCALGIVAPAQEPIRVETGQVIVPVVVGDAQRMRDLKNHPANLFKAVVAGDTQTVDRILEQQISIPGLTAADFHVFDDGKAQAVQNVTYRRGLYWDVRDNIGHHTEYIGPGGGKWSTAVWPAGLLGDIDNPVYLIAYALPESPEGSCHLIKVTVERRNAFVLARNEYCNTKHSADDPLNGTKLSDQLENVISAPTNGSIDIALQAIPFYAKDGSARVQISLDWPPESLKGRSQTKGVLGMVFQKDGRLLTRF